MSQATFQIQTPHDLIRAYSRGTKKQFGQHFLSDPSILGRIASIAQLSEQDHVLEVGPGCGTLTWVMLGRGAQVTSVEIDRQAAEFLREALAIYDGQFTLVEQDATRIDWAQLLGPDDSPRWKVVANLPYNVGTVVFFALTEHAHRLESMTLMFQKEVATRMVADVGDKNYGNLSLMTSLYYDAQVEMMLPPGAFIPPPKVHSALISLVPVHGTRIRDEATREQFVRVVKGAFQNRRKTILNGLKSLGLSREHGEEVLATAQIEVNKRPEQLHFDQFVAMAEAINALNASA